MYRVTIKTGKEKRDHCIVAQGVEEAQEWGHKQAKALGLPDDCIIEAEEAPKEEEVEIVKEPQPSEPSSGPQERRRGKGRHGKR